MKYKLLLCCILYSCSLRSFAEDSIRISFPDFRLLTMDSLTYLSNKELKANCKVVFINFSPSCEHCERTIAGILKSIQKFEQTQFVLSSFESLNAIRTFYKEHSLENYPGILAGQEQNFELTRKLNYSSFPCSILFDQHHIFITKIEGEVKAKAYLRLLKSK